MNKAARILMLAMIFLCGVAIAASIQWWPVHVLRIFVAMLFSMSAGVFLGYVQEKTRRLVEDRPHRSAP